MNPRSAGSAGLRSVALAALCVLLGSPPVRAEPAAEHPAASDRARTSEARRHFQQGRDLLDAGSYVEAIAEFETALSLKPSPELLFNIAQAHRLKGDARQALETYKRFIEISPRGPVADEARDHIRALTRQIEDDQRAAQAREVARVREEDERQRYETEREQQARRRRTGVIALAVGVPLALGGPILGTTLGSRSRTADVIAEISFYTGFFALLPYGLIKVLYNPDPGPFRPTPTISKGVAFMFSF